MGSVGGLMTIQGYMAPAGYTQVTSVSASTALPTAPAQSRMVLIQPESQNIRWRDDGVAPTATVGTLLIANDVLHYSGDFSAFRMIEVTASAKVNVTYYK